MKRMLSVLTLALLVSISVAGVAGATHSNGEGPKHDFVTGTGQFSPETVDQEIHVNAKSDPSGEDPQGHFFIRGTNNRGQAADIRGSVTCLNVNGNNARVGGEIEQSRTPLFPEGRGILLTITDRGEPGDGDGFSGNTVLTPPRRCPPPFPVLPVTQGNYVVVHDAMP